VIRPARPADRPALSRLQTHLREPSPRLLDAAVGSGEGDAPAPATVLVSTADSDPVGYLLAVPGDGTTYVAELVVAPAHRREGRARSLLGACIRDAERVTVTVAPENEAATALYRSLGFERVRRLPDFFADGDALLFARE
jgi:ribosomal-protein-alanine N-acetyltransferase